MLVLILVACGGDGDDAPPDSPATCEQAIPWAAAPALAAGPMQETAAVAVGGKVYILGGFDEIGRVLDRVQVFDAAACAYEAGPPLPAPLHHINAGVVDGTIFVTGALSGIGFTATGETYAWNPRTDAGWSPRAAMPAGTERGAAVVGAIDGTLVVAGGFRGGAAVADVGVYDPVLDEWTAEAPLPAPRDHACGGALDGKLYVIGGRDTSIAAISGAVFELAPGAGWAERTAMPTPRGGTGCSVIGAGQIVVVGGEGNAAAASGVFPDVEAYTVATDTWQALAPMLTPRHGMGAAAVGTQMFVPGGGDVQGFGAVAVHEILTLTP
jgi:N-acetylneuraminic acid mutarotase